jgi:hypothetical protein
MRGRDFAAEAAEMWIMTAAGGEKQRPGAVIEGKERDSYHAVLSRHMFFQL